MAVGNFTPDDLQWRFQGRSGWIKPGEIVKDRDRAWENHVLDKMGPRGLVKLDYGDDNEKAKALSMQLYEEFWLKQIRVFNEMNEQQKNEGRQYSPPSKQLREKADLFDIELVGPWKLRSKAASGGEERATPDAQRVKGLESRVDGIETQLGEIYALLKENLTGAEDKDKGTPGGKGSNAKK